VCQNRGGRLHARFSILKSLLFGLTVALAIGPIALLS